MIKNFAIFFLILLLAAANFFSYMAGKNEGRYGEWSPSKTPPYPEVIIGGEKIKVHRGTYSWCEKPSLFSNTRCVVADSVLPGEVDDSEFTSVKASQKIHAELKDDTNLRGFNISILDRESDDSDPWYTPPKGGQYIYQIQIDWGQEQGDSLFYFYIEVE